MNGAGRRRGESRRSVARASTRTGHAGPCLLSSRDDGNSGIRHSCTHMRCHARSLNPHVRGYLIWPDANCPRGHGCARVRTSNTGTVPLALTATVVRAPEHRVRTSRTKSPAPCIGGPRFRGFPLAEVGECLRSDRRLDLHSHYPGFASPSCPVPMHRVSSPWQRSGRRPVSGQPLRHDGDRRTA